MIALMAEERRAFHAQLLDGVLTVDNSGVPSNADKDSKASVAISASILDSIGSHTNGVRLPGQTSGRRFEVVCSDFLKATFTKLGHLRPGTFEVTTVGGRGNAAISRYDQYDHLIALDSAAKKDPELAAALGADYTIRPDILIGRSRESDETINQGLFVVDLETSRLTPLREVNGDKPILHASVSCKWTIRSDRAQNARSEALNLVRNRKGKLPHVAVVTGEPMPSRLAALALGTGDIDCVYHFALPELTQALEDLENEVASDMLATMVNGKRLRDISDLPLDLVI